MADKQADYTVIEAQNLQDLVNGVCAAQKQGWQVIGSVVARPLITEKGIAGALFMQALVKYESLIQLPIGR